MKKIYLINVVITFLLCFITHNIYKWFPSNLTAIFFPVNESIWEHMKMLYTTFLLTGAINYIFITKKNISISSLICSVGSIVFYLVLFLPFNTDNMIIIFTILIITILLFEYIRLFIINNLNFKKYNTIGFILIIVIYIIFGILTYKPIKIDIFKDSLNNTYGINTYIV